MLESAVENRLRSGVKRLDGYCIKLLPSVAGTPDRLVVLPGPKFYLVELKQADGRDRPVQVAWREKAMRKTGIEVTVLRGVDEVNEWLTKREPREESGGSTERRRGSR